MGSGLLAGRRILITGAAQGLGRAYADAAVEAGAAVVVTDVDAGGVEETAARIVARGGRAVALVADVTDWDAAGGIVEACVRELGGIDGLVNNAGVLGFVRPIHEERADARRALDINVVGVLNVGAHAARAMVEAGRAGRSSTSAPARSAGSTIRAPTPRARPPSRRTRTAGRATSRSTASA